MGPVRVACISRSLGVRTCVLPGRRDFSHLRNIVSCVGPLPASSPSPPRLALRRRAEVPGVLMVAGSDDAISSSSDLLSELSDKLPTKQKWDGKDKRAFEPWHTALLPIIFDSLQFRELKTKPEFSSLGVLTLRVMQRMCHRGYSYV